MTEMEEALERHLDDEPTAPWIQPEDVARAVATLGEDEPTRPLRRPVRRGGRYSLRRNWR